MRKVRPGNPQLAIAYLRVSTEDQRLGPEAQRKDIEDYARRQGVGVVEWFQDQGVSGASELEDRPQLVGAVAALRQHSAGLLLVAKRDRLARDVAVAALIERSVASAGGRVCTADGVGNGEGPADLLVRTVIDGAAAYERAIIRQRTKAALQAKLRRGERAGQIAYGFRLAEDGVRLEEEPQEQQLLTRIRTSSGASLRGLTRQLAEEGFRNRRGNPLALTQVFRLQLRQQAVA